MMGAAIAHYGPLWMDVMRMMGMLMLVYLALGCRAVYAQSAGQTYPMAMLEHNREKLAVDDRQKKLALDAEHLVAMAQTLKASVDATRKDELSLDVIRKADEIEKLAKSVKDRMRQ